MFVKSKCQILLLLLKVSLHSLAVPPSSPVSVSVSWSEFLRILYKWNLSLSTLFIRVLSFGGTVPWSSFRDMSPLTPETALHTKILMT